MLSDGIQTGRGRRAAYLHRDRVHGILRGRRGARLAALTSGGAIPETADYRVVADPDDTTVGTVNEDWAIESMQGDVFLLGSTSWRIRRVEAGVVRVVDAEGAPPTVPFWLGEAPARTAEASAAVSALREAVDERLATADIASVPRLARGRGRRRRAGSRRRSCATSRPRAPRWASSRPSAASSSSASSTRPAGCSSWSTRPYGGRINRALGLAAPEALLPAIRLRAPGGGERRRRGALARPRAELPARATCRSSCRRESAEDVLAQALLLSPMFQVRWRWNLGRALVVLRQRGGRRTPPPIQRMEADDLMAAVFPALAGCQENAGAGPIEIPDHPIVRQTMHDCLHEATDVDGLVRLLRRLPQRAPWSPSSARRPSPRRSPTRS